MKYTELAYKRGDIFTRNIFFPSSDRDIMTKKYEGQKDIYFSVYDYEASDVPTEASDFNAMPKIGNLYFDFDSSELKEAMKEAGMVASFFAELGVDPEHIQMSFSGNKGYHIEIPKEYLPDHDNTKTHLFFKNIAISLRDLLELKTLDTKIYDSRRIFRVINTVNSKSGKRKELLNSFRSIEEGDIIPSLETLSALQPSESRDVQIKTDVDRTPGVRREIEPFMLRLINGNIPEGERNATTYTIALYLKDHGYGADEALKIILQSPIDLTEKEICDTLGSAYSSDKHFGMKENELVQKMLTDNERLDYKVDDITSLLVPWEKVIKNAREQIEKFKKKQLLTYGIDNLDKYLGMIQATELVVVGGVSGIGKSEFVWNIAKKNAKAGIPVAFIGLEMTPEQYALRTVRNKMGMDSSKFKTMDLTDEEKKQLEASMKTLEEEQLPMYFFNPKYNINVSKLEKLIEAATEKFGIKLWIIDHLHYFPAYKTGEDQSSVIATIVTSIKQMTLKYNIPIVLVSHYRKIPQGMKPSLNSFKDSIAIVQVADTILALNRETGSSDLDFQKRLEMSILKSRYGMPCATFYSKFDPKSGEYTSQQEFMYGLNGRNFD